ncbi:pyridoxamine 5'-phosphate oxidase family protein [Mucilaginibacter terrae]|uniref:pyridoxamine 5'-phosphate oxidase family protein n=1 Tax=Mucilaginibacter terrae TaxID=1955052 RepID=UPI00363ACDCC
MLGELTESQINNLLETQLTGRLGCHSDGVTYIVPLNYYYDGTNIVAQSGRGMKISMMQKNPEVCFEVDEIKSIINWQSVILWGTFEEIIELGEKEKALQQLIDRVVPFLSQGQHPSHGITANDSDIGTEVELVIYKIIITKKTGRFEQH